MVLDNRPKWNGDAAAAAAAAAGANGWCYTGANCANGAVLRLPEEHFILPVYTIIMQQPM